MQGGLPSSLWFCCIFSFPHCSPGSVFSVGWLHVQVGMERLLQLPLTSTHGDDKDQERELAVSLLSLSLFSKQQPKQSCESVSQVTTFAQNSLLFPISTCKSQSPSQIYRGQLDMPSITSLPSSLTLVPFVYSIPATLVSLLFFQNTGSIPMLGQFA